MHMDMHTRRESTHGEVTHTAGAHAVYQGEIPESISHHAHAWIMNRERGIWKGLGGMQSMTDIST